MGGQPPTRAGRPGTASTRAGCAARPAAAACCETLAPSSQPAPAPMHARTLVCTCTLFRQSVGAWTRARTAALRGQHAGECRTAAGVGGNTVPAAPSAKLVRTSPAARRPANMAPSMKPVDTVEVCTGQEQGGGRRAAHRGRLARTSVDAQCSGPIGSRSSNEAADMAPGGYTPAAAKKQVSSAITRQWCKRAYPQGSQTSTCPSTSPSPCTLAQASNMRSVLVGEGALRAAPAEQQRTNRAQRFRPKPASHLLQHRSLALRC